METIEFLRSLSTPAGANLNIIKRSFAEFEKTPFIDYKYDKNVLVIKSKDISQISFSACESITRILRLHFSRSMQLVIYVYIGNGQLSEKSSLEMLMREVSSYKNEGAKIEINWFYPENRIDIESIGRYLKTKYRIYLTTIPV
jgi:hypothetical protein